jgi:hypothetical protein
MKRMASMTNAPTIDPPTRPTSAISLPAPAGATHTDGADAPRGRRATLGLIVVFVTQLKLVVDASIVNVALPDIQKQLHYKQSGLSWV